MDWKRWSVFGWLWWVGAFANAAGGRLVCEVGPGRTARVEPMGDYAVVASAATVAAPGWGEVVQALHKKYDACVVTYPEGRLEEALPELRARMPAYVCFVGPAEACGRSFVVGAHRLMRRLDEDPYGDALWGIVTGYAVEDALRLARLREPLTVRRGATSMGPGLLGRLTAGFASNEDRVTDFWVKEEGGTGVSYRAVAPDAARAWAAALQERPVEVLYTSGHATERDWQIAYNKPGGALRHEAGGLYALSQDGTRHPFASTGTKVYLPVGNCLIGHIDRRDCMATAWLHSGGVAQMLGYTVVTFYGYMGWGTGLLFDDGRLSLSEAFFLNNQALLHRLATAYPGVLDEMPGSYEARDIAALRAGPVRGDRDALGLLWDRDTVAFYGDPAWVASYPCSDPAFGYRLEEDGDVWTLRVSVLRQGGTRDPKWGSRPFLALFPERVAEIREVRCDRPLLPVVTDRFVLVPSEGAEAAGDRVTVTFRARAVARARPRP